MIRKELIKALSYLVDFQKDIKNGNKIEILVDNFYTEEIAEKVDKAQLALDKQLRFESKIKTQSGEIKAIDISVALFSVFPCTCISCK